MSNVNDPKCEKEGCHEVHECCDGVIPAGQTGSLKETVAQALAGSGQQVFDLVKTHLVEEELKARTDLVLKGLSRREQLERDIRKVKPDPKTAGYDGEGKVVKEPLFSHEQHEELKKLRQQLKSVEEGLEKALNVEKPCFKKLREVAGK